MERYTKIVATIGPAVASPEGVMSLIEAGIDVARLNFSHGDHEVHQRYAEWVRAGAAATGRNVALLQDVQGPKLRVGSFPGGSLVLSPGSTVRCFQGRMLSEEPDKIFVDYPYLLEDVDVGEDLLLADGLIHLVATAKKEDHLEARVVVGGPLG
ncbi:MAG: pyruvate kinase, partial [Actinomycetota bacterium]|nr:pyruvate kinase [Actinomycetota bacterium]